MPLRSCLLTSFLRRCLIITSWAQVPLEVSYQTSFLHRCVKIISWAKVSPEVSYELVSYIDVL